jgi:hypothetical protein
MIAAQKQNVFERPSLYIGFRRRRDFCGVSSVNPRNQDSRLRNPKAQFPQILVHPIQRLQ